MNRITKESIGRWQEYLAFDHYHYLIIRAYCPTLLSGYTVRTQSKASH